MKFRIKYADQVVGVFVILAFAALATLLLAVGSKQRWFARDYYYNSRFASGSGLSVGTPLLLKGFQIGRVNSIALNGKNEAEIVFVVYDQYVDRVKDNSLLEYVTSPIGLGSQLLFHPGKSEKRASEHSFIPSYDTPEGRLLADAGLVDRPPKDDTITRLLSNMNPLLENVNATVIEVQKALVQVNAAMAGNGKGPVADSLKSLSSTVADVDILVRQINGLVADTTPKVQSITSDVQASLPELLASAEASAKNVSDITANLKKTSEALADPTGLVPKLVDPTGALFGKVDASLAEVKGTLANLNRATAAFADDMPRIVAVIEEARTAIEQAEQVMEGLKNNPLLRGGISDRVQANSTPAAARTLDF